MEHVKLLLTLFNLILGSIVVMFLLFRQRMHKGFPMFSTMALYALLFNLLLAGAVISKYIDINLPPLFAFTEHRLYIQFSQALFILILGGMAACQFRIARVLADYLVIIPGKIAAAALVVAGSGFLSGSLLLQIGYPPAHMILETTGDFLFAGEFLLLLFLLRAGGRMKDRRRKRLIRSYSLLCLSRYPLIFLMLVIPEQIRFFSSIAVLFYINGLPLIWTSLFYGRGTLAEKNPGETVFPENVTEREKEIILLVIAGKSNREIEEILCISSHTVKNHLYNIYRKTNVKSRYDLIVRYSLQES